MLAVARIPRFDQDFQHFTMHEKIKIAFVIESLVARTGGTEGQLLTLLERIDRARFEPVLFCLQDSEWLAGTAAVCPVRVLDLHVAMRPSLLGKLWNFSRELQREGFQVVQTHFRDGNFAGVLAGSLAGTPVIVSTRRGEPYWSSPRELRILRWLDRRVDWFIANSEATRTRYARDEGLDPARVEVIYNGVDLDRFAAARSVDRLELRHRLGLPADVAVVGIVANLRSVKGHTELLHAARSVLQRFPTTHFVLVGEGDQEHALRVLAHELSIDEHVHFLGAREDVPELLGAFDIGVLSSHFESFSNSILEYLAAGLPVVVTDVGGAREVVREGRDGWIVPARDVERMAHGIATLLGRPGGPRALRGGEGLDSRFWLQTMVREHEELYERLVSSAGRGQPRGAPRH